jgi:tetratricopeptide (TPR) repeat protein
MASPRASEQASQNLDEFAQHAKKAQSAIATNNAAVAKEELRAMLKIAPGNANTLANLGMVEFSQGEYAEAAREFEAALTHEPSLWSARAFLGMCKVRLGATEQGQKFLEESLSHVTDRQLHVDSGLALVQCYSISGAFGRAESVLNELKELDSGNPKVLYALYRLHAEMASAALRELTVSDPNSAWVHEVLGQNFMSQEQYSQAAVEFQKALDRNPSLAGLHYQLGEAQLSAARTPENQSKAELEFLAELQMNPRDVNSLVALAEINSERGAYADAKSFATRALAAQTGSAKAHATLAKILEQEGDIKDATAELETAEKLAPEVKTTHYRLSQLYRAQGRTADSDREVAVFRRLSAAEPSADVKPRSSGKPTSN